MFSIGDKVICVCPKDNLVKNMVYTVRNVYMANGCEMVYLEGGVDYYLAKRFKLADPAKQRVEIPAGQFSFSGEMF